MPADAVIRPPRDGEWAEIARLLRACFADEGPEIGGSLATAESVAALKQSGNHLLVMDVGEGIRGFVYLDPLRRAASMLAVDSGFRDAGHGKRLMKAAEAKARTLGWRELLVGVLDTKPRLVTYYQRLGYKDTGLRPEMVVTNLVYTGPTHCFIVLGKTL